MENRQLLEFFDMSIKAYAITTDNYDEYDRDYCDYFCYGSVPDPTTWVDRKVKEKIETAFLSNKAIDAFAHETYFYGVGGEIAPDFLEKIQLIDETLRKIGLYTKTLTKEEVYQLSTFHFRNVEEYVFAILEYRYLCGVFSFKNGFATYDLNKDVFEWMKSTFGENCPAVNYFTYTRKIYYAAEDGTDLQELDYVYAYAVVLQFIGKGDSTDYITADFNANSRYYPESFWPWFMNKGMEFARYDAEKGDTRQFFYRRIEDTTQGHILYVGKKEYEQLEIALTALKKKFPA